MVRPYASLAESLGLKALSFGSLDAFAIHRTAEMGTCCNAGGGHAVKKELAFLISHPATEYGALLAVIGYS